MEDSLGETPNPMLSALIAALSGTAPMDPLALLQTQLATQAQDNPQMAEILRLLTERRQQQQPQEEEMLSSEEEVDAAYTMAAGEAQEEGARHVQELEDLVNKVYMELEALRTRNDALAAALGACYLCFGDDPLCEECGGRGVSGSLAPQPAAFRKYVLPAVRRARAIEVGRGGPAPPRGRYPGQTGAPPQVLDHEGVAHYPFVEQQTKGRVRS
jgi:hypothetical protein